MQFSDLTKAQRQYLASGALGLLIMLGGGWIIGKVSAVVDKSREELASLESKISVADQNIRHSARMKKKLSEIVEELDKKIAQTPPDLNNYSWTTELMYPLGRASRLEIDSISELRDSSKLPGGANVVVGAYAIRITAQGSYASVVGFIDELERNHPMVRVTGVEIRSAGEPAKHQVQLFVQWPCQLQQMKVRWKEVMGENDA